MLQKKLLPIALFILIVILFCSGMAYADEPSNTVDSGTDLALNCTSALLLDGENGSILYAQNADQRCFPASVTKIMTMVLILEAVNEERISLDDMVMVSDAAASMGGSQVYLYPGEQRTVNDMLIAIAVGSGNDAAYAMAEFVGGSYDSFIKMMNSKAQELSMTGTNYVNPHGLHDENHYTTAQDLGKLAYYAQSVPGFLDYTSIYEYEFRPEPKLLTLWNTNRLLKWYDGTDGMKTGYTEEAGRNLVATTKRNGLRLISVILGCEQRRGHFTESMNLLNYGFNSYEYVSLYTCDTIIDQVAITKGDLDYGDLCPEQDIGYVAKKGQAGNISVTIDIPAYIEAPVSAGDIGGKMIVYLDGQELSSSNLVLANDINKCGLFNFWGKLLITMGLA